MADNPVGVYLPMTLRTRADPAVHKRLKTLLTVGEFG